MWFWIIYIAAELVTLGILTMTGHAPEVYRGKLVPSSEIKLVPSSEISKFSDSLSPTALDRELDSLAGSDKDKTNE
jgi:hypothetical protein